MTIIYLRQGDNLVPRYMHCMNADGTYPNLSGATLRFHAGYEGDPDSIIIDKAASLVDVDTARVMVVFMAEDLAEAFPILDAEIQATWPDGMVITFPTRSGRLKMQIVGQVG
jgi:hypothetical protein